jgi:hypothetical protein
MGGRAPDAAPIAEMPGRGSRSQTTFSGPASADARIKVREDGQVDEELRAELLERAARDQTARLSLGAGHTMTEWQTLVDPIDRDNTARLREMISQHGWPGRRLVGDDGAHAAWLLAQHSPPDLQEECLPLLEDAVARGDARPADLAYLGDRVLMHRGEPQIYGTQYREVHGVLELWMVRDPAGLDERRAALGLEPEAENRARLLGTRKPAGGP